MQLNDAISYLQSSKTWNCKRIPGVPTPNKLPPDQPLVILLKPVIPVPRESSSAKQDATAGSKMAGSPFMKSPVRWLSDKEYSANPMPIRALIVASTQIGVSEIPRGSNWGEKVRQYLRSTGIGTPAPWCGAFVTWCLKQAGAGSQLGRQVKYPASTWWWYDWAVSAGRLYGKPQRGDIFVWSTPQGGHMGFVAQVFEDGQFRTIEGNSNDAGDREGYEVCERMRTGLPNHKRRGFIRLSGVKW